VAVRWRPSKGAIGHSRDQGPVAPSSNKDPYQNDDDDQASQPLILNPEYAQSRCSAQHPERTTFLIGPGPVLSAGELELFWRTRVVPHVKTLSPARSGCDVLPLPDLATALGQLIYVTKEASPTHDPFDCHASVCLPG